MQDYPEEEGKAREGDGETRRYGDGEILLGSRPSGPFRPFRPFGRGRMDLWTRYGVVISLTYTLIWPSEPLRISRTSKGRSSSRETFARSGGG